MTELPEQKHTWLGTYEVLCSTLNRWQSLPLLIIRLYFGYQCARAGIRHLETFSSTVERFTYWRIPFPTFSAAASGGVETAAGLLLYLGLFSRVAAMGVAIDFFLLMLAVNLSAADFSLQTVLTNIWGDQDYILKDNSFPTMMAALVVLFLGPGWVSVDGFVRYWVERRREIKSRG
jgi:uncharacterized membrane protein YphA (DoxX/SURF4 family)